MLIDKESQKEKMFLYRQTYTLRPTCCASAAAARAVSAVGFSNMRCTVKSSLSRDSEYSGLMSTFCLFNSTTSHGRKAEEKEKKEREGQKMEKQKQERKQ